MPMRSSLIRAPRLEYGVGMRIESLKLHGKVYHPPGRYFDDLAPQARQRAETLLRVWRIRWGRHNMPNWRLALLVGQARRLAQNPPGSSWGRRMAAAKGGYAVQQRYRLEGRNPTEAATEARRTASVPRKQQAATRRADGAAIIVSGTCSTGGTGRQAAENMVREILQKITIADQRLATNHLLRQEDWLWDLRLIPVPFPRNEP
jgi:hypothetical protein